MNVSRLGYGARMRGPGPKEISECAFHFVGAKVQQAQEWTEKAARMGLAGHTLFLDVVPPKTQ
jgi:hypothetical protein